MTNKTIDFTKRLTLLLYGKKENQELNNFFSDYFYHCIFVYNYQDAKKMFEENHIDIIVVDIEDNHEEQYKFIENKKTIKEGILSLVVADTQNVTLLQEALFLGVDGYTTKPIDKDIFSKLLVKLEKKFELFEDYENNKQNLELLKQYQEIADQSSIISKTDEKGKITYANDNFCKISGYSKNELYGKSHNIIRHPENPSEIYQDMWETIKNKKKEWTGIIKNKSKSGGSYFVKTMIKPILDKDGNIKEFIALRDDISKIMSDKNQLLDSIESNELSVLVLLQIDNFEMLEKFYSVTVANQIERTFGYQLLSYLPPEFTFESIYSLDNGSFALLTTFESFLNANTDINVYLNNFVENVRKSTLKLDDFEYDINISLSYSYGKYMLFEDAKAGLEEAKQKNLNLCHSNDYSIKGHKEAKRNLEIIKMIKVALEKYKIVSYFQPIIDNKTGEIEKYESLVRLIDETGQVMSPFTFLNISKRGQYYTKITHRVLENSFDMLNHVTTKLSINLSALDIEKDETRGKIYKLLEKYKDHSHRLIFELLEEENVKDLTSVKKFITRVKSKGVQIAIDDFGAGYSNFERLLEFEPDILKIDGSLIRNITTDKYNQNLVSSIVEFAKKQNIKTVAEFVETEDIFTYLKELGVDYSQGYYFGKPEELKGS